MYLHSINVMNYILILMFSIDYFNDKNYELMSIQYSCSEFGFVQTTKVGKPLLSVSHFQLLAFHIGYIFCIHFLD